MDRKEFYDKWNSLMFDGTVFFDKRVIKDFEGTRVIGHVPINDANSNY